MKRLFSLALAGMMLFSVPAYAETVKIDQIEVDESMVVKSDDTTKKYSVSYGKAKQGNEYMLWALKGGYEAVSSSDFVQGNVLYVDQATGSASGVSYDGFLPMRSADSTLVITGQGMDNPIIVGYIKGEGGVVYGKIEMLRRTMNFGGVTLTFTGSNGEEISVTTNEENKFEVALSADTYTVKISKDGYLAYVEEGIVVESDGEFTKEIAKTLLPGDVNIVNGVKGDGFITPADLLAFKKAYLAKTDMSIDFDGTGIIGGGDLICFKAAWAIRSYN